MELIGKLKVIGEEQTFPSGFSKRAFVITTEEQYPNDIQFELLKDKGSLINSFKNGDRVKISFDIRGKEYNGKYYNNLVAWRIDNADAQGSNGGGAPNFPPPAADSFAPPSADDDLPF
jgi:hypothetical protein